MIGQTISHYRIVGKLGEGGMGAVYEAEDERLGRRVALKFLPEETVDDGQALERFKREARAASSLNHPHICTLHDIGEHDGRPFLVMERLEGQTLEERIARGSLDTDEILKLAIQIAEALDAAHSSQIVHRDIKPANVFVTERGDAKILDFGLAKTSPLVAGDETQAETAAFLDNLTRPGFTLGTVAYMSPEQALGTEVDRRTDLFSLGVVLYEMATGQRPFQGEAPGSVLNDIINARPTPPSRLRPGLPEDLGRTIDRCLEKDPDLRYQSARDLMADLKRQRRDESAGVSTATPPARSPAPADPVPSRRRRPWLAGAAAVAGLAALGWWLLQSRGPQAPQPPPVFIPFTADGGYKATPSWSPDGERVAYAWRGPTEDLDIYVKALGTGAEPLRLTDDPGEEVSPVWSPDGREIAFIRSGEAGNAVYVVPSLGGRERKLTELAEPLPTPAGLSWSSDGRWIAFSEKSRDEDPFRIVALSVGTLERQALTSPPASIGGDFAPAFSPDGEQLAFARRVEVHWGNNDVWAQPIEGGEARPVTAEEHAEIWSVSWTPDGEEILFSVGFGGFDRSYRVDAGGGTPEPLVILGDGSGEARANDDRLVYRKGLAAYVNIWRVPGRASEAGERTPERLLRSTSIDLQPAIRSDGSQVAFSSSRGGVPAIWVVQSDGSRPTQVTGNDHLAGTPGWSPDGRQIAYDSPRSGNWDVWVVAADSGVSRQLTFEPSNDGRPSWSRDGRWVYFGSDRSGEDQIWKIPADGGAAEQVTRGGGFYARESWDGRYLYFVRSSSPSGIWRIPVGGGEETEIVSRSIRNFWNWDVSRSGLYYLSTPARPNVLTSYVFGYRGTHTLYFQEFSTGEVSALLAREGVSALDCVAVSPDERWILYSEVPAGESELVVVQNFR